MSEVSRDPVPVAELIRKLIEKQSFSTGGLPGRWEDIVGEHVARHTAPVSLKKGVLRIHTLDNVWKHHLELNSEELLKKINSHFPVPVVHRLVIKVGPFKPVDDSKDREANAFVKPERKKKGRRKVKTFPLTPESKKFIKELRDPELKQIARRLLKLFPPEGVQGSGGSTE